MLYNKRCFFKEIFTLVFVLHLILLGVLFVCDTGKFHQERFVVNTNNLQSTVVFIPLKKRVQEQKTVVTSGKKSNGTRKVMNYNEYEKKLAAQKKKQKKTKKTVSQKKPIVKQKPLVKPVVKPPVKSAPKVPEKKAVTSLQQEKNKKLELEKAQAKEQALLAAKKAAEKKALTQKEQALLAAKKIADKQAADKAAAQAKSKAEADKKAEDLAQEKAAQEEKNVPTPELAVVEEKIIEPLIAQEKDNKAELQDDDDEDDIDLDSISFVGSQDLEMMQIKEQIQLEVVKYYKPPVGIAKKAVCELVVIVGLGGKAERVTVKKGSGSLANDMCARAALLKVKFPKEVIGKEIIVELGQ